MAERAMHDEPQPLDKTVNWRRTRPSDCDMIDTSEGMYASSTTQHVAVAMLLLLVTA
jgi:hypothetical protein